jgi:hypothetical protein
MSFILSDTPLLLRKHGIPFIKEISELVSEKQWVKEDNGSQHYRINKPLYSWGKCKWNKILKINRCKTDKKIYRINTNKGLIDVTEDYILSNKSWEFLNLKDCTNTDILACSYPKRNIFRMPTINEILKIDGETDGADWLVCGFMYAYKNYIGVPAISWEKFYFINELRLVYEDFNLNQMIENLPNELDIFWYGVLLVYEPSIDGTIIINQRTQKKAAYYYYIARSLGYIVQVKYTQSEYMIICYPPSARDEFGGSIKSITLMSEKYTDYVYQIETENGTFQAGIGELNFKNIDYTMV